MTIDEKVDDLEQKLDESVHIKSACKFLIHPTHRLIVLILFNCIDVVVFLSFNLVFLIHCP